MLIEWERDRHTECRLLNAMLLAPSLFLPQAFCHLVRGARGNPVGQSMLRDLPACSEPCQRSGFAYHKLAQLAEFVETSLACSNDDAQVANTMLQAMERFSAGVGQWLKVAGGGKADLLETVLSVQGSLKAWELVVELGLFVGYSAVRMCQTTRSSFALPVRILSLEVDPVHALVARHFLNLSRCLVEVWVGQAVDTETRIPEDLGAGLVFMDHRGTRFQEDIRIFQSMLPCIGGGLAVVADNVLKPGAPVCAWRAAVQSASLGCTNLWSLPEFVQEASEDWMLAQDLARTDA